MSCRSPHRVVTVWCPDWPVTAAGVADHEPAVVVRANRVVARSAAAAAAGVRHGQRRRQAQACCPEAQILRDDPDHDARAFEPAVTAVAALTPRVEVVEPGWLCVDARGPSRYYGGDRALAQRLASAVARALGRVGGVQVGVADGRFTSVVAARRARAEPLVIVPGGSVAFLAPLSVQWLQVTGEVDADMAELLARVGLYRLGEVAALDPAAVLARFGRAGARAHALARGIDQRPVQGDEPVPHRRIDQRFDPPVDQLTPLVFAAKQAADDLAGQLAADGQVGTRLVVTAETEHQERTERAWYRAGGLTAPAMVDRVRWQLAAWTASGHLTAGVVLLRLTVEEARADDGEQARFWGGLSAADERAHRAITHLAGIVGDDAVLVPAWHGGHLPGDRYRWVPATACDLASPATTADRLAPTPPGDDPRVGPWPGAVPPPSPTVVEATPRPASLVDANGAEVAVTGRGELAGAPATLAVAGGRVRPVTGWAGPWPLHGFDDGGAPPRRAARLQVVTDDGTAHLLVAEHRRWWVLATYA